MAQESEFLYEIPPASTIEIPEDEPNPEIDRQRQSGRRTMIEMRILPGMRIFEKCFPETFRGMESRFRVRYLPAMGGYEFERLHDDQGVSLGDYLKEEGFFIRGKPEEGHFTLLGGKENYEFRWIPSLRETYGNIDPEYQDYPEPGPHDLGISWDVFQRTSEVEITRIAEWILNLHPEIDRDSLETRRLSKTLTLMKVPAVHTDREIYCMIQKIIDGIDSPRGEWICARLFFEDIPDYYDIGSIDFRREGCTWELVHRIVLEEFSRQGILTKLIQFMERVIQRIAMITRTPNVIIASAAQVNVILWLLKKGFVPENDEENEKMMRIFSGDPGLMIERCPPGRIPQAEIDLLDRCGFTEELKKKVFRKIRSGPGGDFYRLNDGFTRPGDIEEFARKSGLSPRQSQKLLDFAHCLPNPEDSAWKRQGYVFERETGEEHWMYDPKKENWRSVHDFRIRFRKAIPASQEEN